MMSTSRGWVDNLNFLAERDFRALRFTERFCWYAEMSSREISAQAFARDSFYMVRTPSTKMMGRTSDIVILAANLVWGVFRSKFSLGSTDGFGGCNSRVCSTAAT